VDLRKDHVIVTIFFVTMEKGTRPVVTVIMPAYNGARTLRDSADSVLDQTLDSLELVIVDDGSTDATAEIAAGIAARDRRVHVVHRSISGGPAAARNNGIESARGRYLAFCDADDLWLPTKLERQLELARRTGAALIYSAYQRIDGDSAEVGTAIRSSERVVHVPTMLSYQQLLRSNMIGCLTAVVDTGLTGPVSMPDTPGAEDWALWLRVLREGGSAAGIDEPLALYRVSRPGSHSARRWNALRAVWRVLRDEEQLSIPSAAAHVVTDAAAALRKSRL
jgi:glycosyltransferase involved in cell wall biosynthesis